ncbi:MAG: Minf_1886 family protein [candidate division WOR-3 bacterium]
MNDKIDEIVQKNPQYKKEAYLFVLDALEYAKKKLKASNHISGQELLLGFKELAQKEFGILAKTVLEYWGIKSTNDVGEMVFNLCEAKILTKRENDKKEDFANFFDFEEEFIKKYQPSPKEEIKKNIQKE